MFSKPVRYCFLFLLAFFALVNSKMQAQPIKYFGGEMVSDLDWTKEYIYVVNSDLIIPRGFSLTIHSGVEVYVNYGVSIICNGGGLVINGEENGIVDTVFIRRNTYTRQHFDQRNWYWKRIYVTQATDNLPVYVNYAHVEGAENAFEIESSSDFLIQNSTFRSNHSAALKLKNALRSQIRNNLFDSNYVGIEFISDMANSVGNNVSGNVFSSGITSVLISGKSEGKFVNNFIDENVFDASNCAIFAQDKSILNTQKNWIRNNTIHTNKDLQSYGIWVEMDSLQIENNIFWQNERALGIYGAKQVSIKGNTFYQNDSCVAGINPSWNADFYRNTFSENNFRIARLSNTNSNMTHNNIVNYDENIFQLYNLSDDMIFVGNNYWGTTDTITIAKILWDIDDDENSGKLEYKPLLKTNDTTAPLTPPYRIKKQLVDGRMRLSWKPNSEENLKGYRIYSGDFKYYTYTDFRGLIVDTVCFLDKSLLDIDFAVTATDFFDHQLPEYQREKESAYAFAHKAPFAGRNDTVCESQVSYLLDEANVPYEYHHVEWETSGSGRFSNPGDINPAYFPSKDDFKAGEVTLILNVYTSESEKISETVNLSLLQSVGIFAGNDSIVKQHDIISLNQAEVSNFSKIKWETKGDGSFDDPTILHPVYMTGEEDEQSGRVQLILYAESKCESTSDTVTFQIVPTYMLKGKVWINDRGAENAQVILKNLTNTCGFYEQNRVKTNDLGEFEFHHLIPDNYILYASPDTLNEKASIAYYAEQRHWQHAHQIDLIGNTFDVDIHLPTDFQQFPQGTGIISGMFKLPSDLLRESQIYCTDWFNRAEEMPICDGGFSNIAIVLYNSDASKLIDYRLTDHKGMFSFRNLPFGRYVIFAEIFGYETIRNEIIQLTPVNYHVDDVELTLQESKISLKRNKAVNDDHYSLIYPNPVSNTFYIKEESENWQSLQLFDAMGILIMQVDLSSSKTPHAVSLEHIAPGLYFLRLESGQLQKSVKILKN